MKTYNNLFAKLCSFENLEQAYRQARKHKNNNPAVKEFEKHWKLHLCTLLRELKNQTYNPKPLKKFVLRDPKTRVICVSDFRDRIVHHALVNILQPIFEPRFITDSFASTKGKGTLPALRRFDCFKRKVSHNGTTSGFALKADIKHYFDTVDHQILLSMIGKRVRDHEVIWLVRIILDNYHSGIPGKGMPLGNWTSRFFANVYLNELDQFVKHNLKATYYLRYVDDFVVLHQSKNILQSYEVRIKSFLAHIGLELHPTKCSIGSLDQGITLLGFRVHYHHKTPRSRNLRKIRYRLTELLDSYQTTNLESWKVLESLNGWCGYAMHANTYKLRTRLTEETRMELEKRTLLRRAVQFAG
ncbi:hypothetical protein HY641_02190 [Candidatus Woesearchaeota archaeon]|nr:hypothetical protein [Candidatus Woesearchaeota archaeon]